ncbi:L-serine ammonia-lyase [Flavobacterium psychrophilum]|nr:L-serine ammonia-lyase [Flavobacterium psychrophilum]
MEECISVFDMLKIGVGPSSSHTLGPWRAAEKFLEELTNNDILEKTIRVKVDLYGSLSLTGTGHATDLAVMLGLSGQDPEYIPVQNISGIIKNIEDKKEINLSNKKLIPFIFCKTLFLIKISCLFMPMD